MENMTPDASRHLTRRQALVAAGALGLGATAYGSLGCGGEPTASTTSTSTSTTTASAGASCVLTPEQTEGPYYIEDSLIRSDITEGREGAPLELRLTVQDAASCEPIADATVEVWHCDAGGAYSGFGDADGEERFLRGGQTSDADGAVTFQTIYPGWYQGRTTHIHVKVHVGGAEVHTGQLYFDPSMTEAVYRTALYAGRGEPDTTNSADGIYRNGGDRSTLALSRAGDGYMGRLTLGVRT